MAGGLELADTVEDGTIELGQLLGGRLRLHLGRG
jgi:hypothetical protein